MAGRIGKFIKKILWRIKLAQADSFWRYMDGECWGWRPPSFYATHTREEVEKSIEEEIAICRKKIEDLERY